jgi:glycogen synthase
MDSDGISQPEVLANFKWTMNPILFITPELGKWSTFGGLGVMVDDLIHSLSPIMRSSAQSPTIWVCSPYYERNRKGERGYLARDKIPWSFNIEVDVGIERVTVGVFESTINGVRHFFLHNAKYFPSIYPDFGPVMMTAFLVLMAKCPLEICCKLKQIPSTIVTNDWTTGLTAAYAKNGFFGKVFITTKFMHIIHNLDANYEGRIYPKYHEDVGRVHMLDTNLLVDPFWNTYCVNPSRCALLTCDNWGTVSFTYKKEILEGSPLAPLLSRFPNAFAHPNGIPLKQRLERILSTGFHTHAEAKFGLQRKYFGGQSPNPDAVILSFVGRITYQKGVHLILDISEQLINQHNGMIQIIIGGAANPGEEYARNCAHRMKELARRYPNNFWADPDAFFVDGALVNLASDWFLMPSLFEPSGITQQESFAAGTGVIAFRTGGLKDTVFEFYNGKGNGYTFESHTTGDFLAAIERGLNLYWNDKEGYELLRRNAFASVITCDMVAKAWLKEFFRLHGREVELTIKERRLAAPTVATPDSFSDTDSVDLTTFGGSDIDESTSQASSPISIISRTFSRDANIAGSITRSVRICYEPPVTANIPKSVLLSGSFDGWASRIPLKWDGVSGVFYVDVKLPLGKWLIKLIVDGVWLCIDDYPTEVDRAGNLNNVILVD